MYIVTENLIKKVRCLQYILIHKLRSIHIWISKKYFNLGIVHKFRSKWWSAIDNRKPISCIKFYITKHLGLYVSIAVVKCPLVFFPTKIRIRGTSILFVKNTIWSAPATCELGKVYAWNAILRFKFPLESIVKYL